MEEEIKPWYGIRMHDVVPPDACQGLGSLLGPELKDSGWEEMCLIILEIIKKVRFRKN